MGAGRDVSMLMRDLGKLREQIAAGQYPIDASSIASALLAYADADEPAGSPPVGARRGSEHRPWASDRRDATIRRRASG